MTVVHSPTERTWFGDTAVTSPVTLAMTSRRTVCACSLTIPKSQTTSSPTPSVRCPPPHRGAPEGDPHPVPARCPTACECWLHPKAVDAHLGLGRCLGRRWVDDAGGSAMVSGVEAAVLLAVLPEDLVDLPARDGHAVMWLHGDRVVSFRSPNPGIAPRRWSQVVLAAAAPNGGVDTARGLGPGGVRRARGRAGPARVAGGVRAMRADGDPPRLGGPSALEHPLPLDTRRRSGAGQVGGRLARPVQPARDAAVVDGAPGPGLLAVAAANRAIPAMDRCAARSVNGLGGRSVDGSETTRPAAARRRPVGTGRMSPRCHRPCSKGVRPT